MGKKWEYEAITATTLKDILHALNDQGEDGWRLLPLRFVVENNEQILLMEREVPQKKRKKAIKPKNTAK